MTAVESVYSAVRTDSLYKADYVSSLKGQCHFICLNSYKRKLFTQLCCLFPPVY